MKVSKNGCDSYLHKPGKEPLVYKTLGKAIDEAAEKWADWTAIISHWENITLTMKQTKEQVDALAAGLLKLGLKRGDRLALLGVNTVHWYLTMLAAAKVGIITALLNPGNRAAEIDYAINKVKARAILTDHRFKTQDYPAMLAELAPDMTSAPHGRPLSCPQLPHLSYVIVATEEQLPGTYRWKDLFHQTDSKEELLNAERKVQPDDPACIIFTSGTTGNPKGAVLSHFSLINGSHAIGREAEIFNTNKLFCHLAPFFHIFGVLLGIVNSVVAGNALVVPGPIFVKELVLAVLEKYKIHCLYGTATMFLDLADHVRALLPSKPNLLQALSNVRKIGFGGSSADLEVITTIANTFPEAHLCHCCGMTETCSSWVGTMEKVSLEKTATTVGTILEDTEVKIVDSEGKVVPVGSPGEAWVRSPRNFLGYWGDEEKTTEAKTEEGWVKTGDIMTLWDDGYLSISGRIKEMIIRGGENIFPVEIENFLSRHPDIVSSQVFGVSDKRMGEEVAACIKLKPESKLTENGLKEYCKGKISHFKIPRYIKFVDKFPATPSGKVQKYLLKEMIESDIEGKQKPLK